MIEGKTTEISNRNCGIELLRILLMYMVCVLHVLGQCGVLQACERGTLEYKAYWLLYIFSNSSVDGFAFISGYTATNARKKYEKLTGMWFQVFFYSFVITLLFTMLGVNTDWSARNFVLCAFPTLSNKFWYFTAYFVLFLSMPVLNCFFFELSFSSAQKVFIILVVLFSLSDVIIVVDAFKTMGGYSTLWVIIVYCIGVLARRIELFARKKSVTLVFIWAGLVLFTWMSKVYFNMDRFTRYVSPTILFSAIIMVILFSRLSIHGSVIMKLASLMFGVYLFQLNEVVWYEIMPGSLAFIADVKVAVGVVYVLAFAILIFAIGVIVEFVRKRIAELLAVQVLCQWIVYFLNRCLHKMSFILK